MKRFPTLLGAALLLAVLTASPARSAPACVATESGGVGGTGSPIAVGGVGGTGAPVAVGGVAGTGMPVAVGGVGGTGSPQRPENGGVGGTGQQARDTGILGTITGFGSVCVNGLEVQYDRSTPISRNGEEVSSDRLALGQVVAIVANDGASSLTARRIAILEALSGPISGSEKDGVFRVMEQPVRVTGETLLAGIGKTSELAPGMAVRVSGYRNAVGEVVASRVELAPGLREESLVGSVAAGPTGRATVGGVPLSDSPTSTANTQWLVRGRWDGSVFHAGATVPALPFGGNVGRIVVEGLVLGHEGAGRMRISGFDVSYGTPKDGSGTIAQAPVGRRVRVVGWIEEEGRLRATQVELMPMGTSGVGGMSGGGGGMSSGGGGMSAQSGMGSSAVMAPGGNMPQRLLPIVRPGALGGMGGGGRMGR